MISVLLVSMFSLFHATGQTNYEADTQKINRINERSFELISEDPDSARILAEEALSLSEKHQYFVGLGDAYNRLGILKKNESKYEEALTMHRKALQFRKRAGVKTDIGKSLNNIGVIYRLTSQYDSAIYYHLSAVRTAESESDMINLCDYYNNLAIDFQNAEDLNSALRYYRQSFEIAKSIHDTGKLVRSAINTGSLYIDLGNDQNDPAKFDSAIYILKTALNSSNDMSDKQLGDVFNNLGLAYQYKVKPDSALHYYLNARKYWEHAHPSGMEILLSNIGLLYIEQGQLEPGIDHILQSNEIARTSGRKDLLAKNFRSLSDAYWANGQKDQSYNALLQYIAYNDSVFDEQKSLDIADMRIKYETEKQEQNNKLLEKENLLQQKTLKERELQMIGISVAFALAIIIATLLFNRRQLKRKIEYQQKLEGDRMRISKDLHDDIGGALTSISMYSGVVQEQLRKSGGKDTQSYMAEIEETSRELLGKMGDLVWAINPVNDHFENLIKRIRSSGMRLLQANSIAFEFQSDTALDKVLLPMEIRHHLYMMMKESITNAAKYSKAEHLWLSISKRGSKVVIEIKDDGIGFDSDLLQEGNGLANMKHRAEQIGGELDIQSEPGKGTSIRISFHLY